MKGYRERNMNKEKEQEKGIQREENPFEKKRENKIQRSKDMDLDMEI